MAAPSAIRAAKEKGVADKSGAERAAANARAAPKAPKGKTAYRHVMPDGTVVTRTSAREYTHVVTGISRHGGVDRPRKDLSWSGSAENAEKTKRQLVSRGFDAVRVEKLKPPTGDLADLTAIKELKSSRPRNKHVLELRGGVKVQKVRDFSSPNRGDYEYLLYVGDPMKTATKQHRVKTAAGAAELARELAGESIEEAFTAPSGGGQPRYGAAARDARRIARSQGLKPGSHRLPKPGKAGGGGFDEKEHPRGSAGTQKGGQFIAKGSSGDGVRAVQKTVGARTDGKYGRRTEAAVRAFQKEHGLVVDGKVGRQTAQALAGNFGKARRTKTGKLSSADRRMIRKAAKRGRVRENQLVEDFDPDQPRGPDGRWIKSVADLVPGKTYEWNVRGTPQGQIAKLESISGGMVRRNREQAPHMPNFPARMPEGFFEAREVPDSVAQAAGKQKVGDAIEVRRHGKTYTGTIDRITRGGKVYAKVTYDNGVTKIVPVD